MMEWQTPVTVINEALSLNLVDKYSLTEGVVHAVRYGNGSLAAHFIEKDLKQNVMGSQFNKYHQEALVRGDQKWKDVIREVSARKKGPLG